MDENNNNIPAAGEQVLFDTQPKAEEIKPEEPITEEPTTAEPITEEPKIEIPQVEIPKVEEPQTQYQQVPPVNAYQQQTQNQYQNQQYNPIPPNPIQVEPDTTPMTMGEWIVTLLLLCIPCVNIIMLFVWAFGDKTGNLNRRNFAKAQLIIMGIVLALYLLVVIIMAIAIGASFAY